MRRSLRLHAYAARAALARMAGQPVATLLAIGVIGTAVAIPLFAAVVLRSLEAVASRIEATPHVGLYLDMEAGEADVRRVEAALRASPEVRSVRFVPRDKALEELKASTHLAELLATLDRNPLPHAFVIQLRPEATSQIAAIRARWQQLPKVDQVAADAEWAEKLSRWSAFATRILVATGAGLALAVAFIVGHLIRLQVVMRREEIEVSQLIGATAADVCRPFLYHGIAQGLLAGVVAVGLAGGVAAWLGAEARQLGPSYLFDLKIIFHGHGILAALVGGLAVLGWAAAWISVRWELRRFAGTASGNPGRG